MALTQGSSATWADIRALFDRIHAQRKRWAFDTKDVTTSDITSKYGSKGSKINASLITSMKELLQSMTTNTWLKTPADTTGVGSDTVGALIKPVNLVNLQTVIKKVEDTCGFYGTFNVSFGTAFGSFDGSFGTSFGSFFISHGTPNSFGTGFSGGFSPSTGFFNNIFCSSVDNGFRGSQTCTSDFSTFYVFGFENGACSANLSGGNFFCHAYNITVHDGFGCLTHFSTNNQGGFFTNHDSSWYNNTPNENVHQLSDSFFTGFNGSVSSGNTGFDPGSGSFCDTFGFSCDFDSSFCSTVFNQFGTRNTTVFAEFRTTGNTSVNVAGFCGTFNAAAFYNKL